MGRCELCCPVDILFLMKDRIVKFPGKNHPKDRVILRVAEATDN